MKWNFTGKSMRGHSIIVDQEKKRPILRVVFILCVVLLHIGVHHYVNAFNAQRPTSDLYQVSTSVDELIPYLGWTWVIYYMGDVYILLWAPVVVWMLPQRKFVRAMSIFALMIIVGGILQLLLPARSPWPDNGSEVQRWFHRSVIWDPFVCLPSMHVALALLPACVSMTIFQSRWFRVATVILVTAITLSTLTLKEHYVLDAVSGILLGGLSFIAWKSDFRLLIRLDRKGAHNDHTERAPV